MTLEEFISTPEGILQMADAEIGPYSMDEEYHRLRTIMAASKELLEALESARGDLHNARFMISKHLPDHHWLSGFDRGIAKIDAAIAKARGKA